MVDSILDPILVPMHPFPFPLPLPLVEAVDKWITRTILLQVFCLKRVTRHEAMLITP